MLFHFLVSHTKTFYPSLPASVRVHPHLSTHSLSLPPLPSADIPLHWDIKPWEDQGALLPSMHNKVILCHICGWSRRSRARACTHAYLCTHGGPNFRYHFLLFPIWGILKSWSLTDPMLHSRSLYLSVQFPIFRITGACGHILHLCGYWWSKLKSLSLPKKHFTPCKS